MWRRIAIILQIVTVVFAAAAVIPSTPDPQHLVHTYFIRFQNETSEQVQNDHLFWFEQLASKHPRTRVRHLFTQTLNGYSARIPANLLRQVKQRQEIQSIENISISIQGSDISKQKSYGKFIIDSEIEPSHPSHLSSSEIRLVSSSKDSIIAPGKGWNFNRISHRNFTKGYDPGPWQHDSYLGRGVRIYVLDTGINTRHPGFLGSSVRFGANFVSTVEQSRFVITSAPKNGTLTSTSQEASLPQTARDVTGDTQGHGTMCAGTIAGKHGLSPESDVISVRVADDSNRSACDDVVAGINWVLADQMVVNGLKVISLSQYGFTGTPIVNEALEAAVRAGVHVVASAGNDGVDACDMQPGNARGVTVVGSVDAYNRVPVLGTVDADGASELEGSNVGRCVTVFAPGSKVPTLDTDVPDANYSYFGWGTSVAAPQVAALIANRLSKVGSQRPEVIRKWLVSQATRGQIEVDAAGQVLRGAPNLIAFSSA